MRIRPVKRDARPYNSKALGQMGQVSMLGEMMVPLPYPVLGFNLHLDQYVHLDLKLAPSPAKLISTFVGH